MGRVNKVAIPDRMIMRLVVSIVLLSAGLFVILSERYDPNAKHWAYATVGTILGFWLKGPH